jgi:RHS repeat-associated protein
VVAAGVSTEDYDYDGEGRVNEKRLTFAGRSQPMTITYGYDALGRITQTTYPQQYRDNITNPLRKIVVPAYDAASRVSGLKVNNLDYASQLTYNAASQITSMLVGTGVNQLTESYSFEDRTGLLSSQSLRRGATTLMSYSYGYQRAYCDDPNAACDAGTKWAYSTGQLTKVINNGPIGEWKEQKFEYDLLGRLEKAEQYKWVEPDVKFGLWQKTNYWTQNYSYDRYGNRTAVAASNNTGLPVTADGIPSLTFDPATNRITTAGFVYDPAGNQLQNNTGQAFFYDAAGRLAKVKNLSGTTLATYTYGATNHRLITQTGSESSTEKTYYIWEGNSVITEYVEQTSATMPKWSKNYIYLGERLLATEAPNGSGEIVHYHHPDRLGTKLVTNNLDTTSFYQVNLPFGTPLVAESTSGITSVTNRRFTSYDRSATTGLDYAVNRQYDSRHGRFTQVDPLGMAAASLADAQSLNMYSYVGNDPVNRVDPDGQFWGALFKFIAGLFTNLKPNVINGSFTYRNIPPVSVSFTPNFQNVGVGFAGAGFDVRRSGHWLPDVLGSAESLNPTVGEYLGRPYPPIYCRRDVIEAMKRAWSGTGNGTLGTEAGFVTNGTPTSYQIIETKSGNYQGHQKITIITGGLDPTFALFHVHPGTNMGSMWPSTPGNNKLDNKLGDTGIADQYNIQFYVISRNGLTLYDPRTKNEPNKGMTLVRENLDWTKPCK